MEWHCHTGPSSDTTSVSRGGLQHIQQSTPGDSQSPFWQQWWPENRAKHGKRVIHVCSGLLSPWQSFWPGFPAVWAPQTPSGSCLHVWQYHFFKYYLHCLLYFIKCMKSCFWGYVVRKKLNNDTNFSLCYKLRLLQPSRQRLLLKADVLVWQVAENSQCGKEWFLCYPQGALWDSEKTTQPDVWRCWTTLSQIPGRAQKSLKESPCLSI